MRSTQAVFYTLLAIAASKKEISGYEIIVFVRYFSTGKLHITSSTVYPTLKKLKKRGLIQEVRRPMELRRRFYQITSRGKKFLNTELGQLNKTLSLAYKSGLLP